MKLDFRRILMSALGVLISACSVGLLKMAAMGVDPFQSFMNGLNKVIPIEFGTLYVITNAVLLLFSLLANRHLIGLGTFVNLFLVGYVVDFSYKTLQNWFGVPTLLGRIVFLILGFIILCFGASMYMVADSGVSTYDAIPITIAYKWNKGKFKYVRILCDLCCVLLSIVLSKIGNAEWSEIGISVGVGTILTALCMGPLVDFFNEHISKRLLNENHSSKSI